MDKDNDMREWKLDDEILLFDLMCDFKPAGHNKDKQMSMIVEKMNQNMAKGTTPFSAKDIWTKLGGMYDLGRVDELEEYIDEEEDEVSGEEDDTQNDKLEDNKEDVDQPNKDPDSSGLSDVEADLPNEREVLEEPKNGSRGNAKNKKDKDRQVDSKEHSTDLETNDAGESHGNKDDNDDGDVNDEDNDNDDENEQDGRDEADQDEDDDENEGDEGSLPKRVTRGAKKHQHDVSEHTETPKPKKRTRSSARLDAVETPPPSRRSQKGTTPPPQQTPIASAKRRKKSDVQELEPDKSNTRRSTRSSVPATTPLKPQAPPIRRSARKK